VTAFNLHNASFFFRPDLSKKLQKKSGVDFPHFECFTNFFKKTFKILLASTCAVKKKAALLHSQSGTTAAKTIAATSFGRREAEFFDMMKRVTR